ncbi:MAG: serine--tRNA ligase [Acidobacteria bacterium]|nr:serine--tRNA ligase [Acidobacteriota bacterium]
MIDLTLLRRETEKVRHMLARRGVSVEQVDELLALDIRHRELLARAEEIRAEVKELSRLVGDARRSGDTARADELTARSRERGDEERHAAAEADTVAREVRELHLMIPNLPADDAPDGRSEDDNVEIRQWWPGMDEGSPFPEFAEHQRVAHWDIGAELGILDLEAGAQLAGSMFPLYRGDGARLLRALTAFALDAHFDAYEEIRPPSVALTETMMSTGHLPKSRDDMYAIERDDLWAIPTAEVPLTSMHRGDILALEDLPIRMTAATQCFRREAGAAGRDTRGLLRVHEFEKVELFAYCTPEQAIDEQMNILSRAEQLLRALALPYRVLDLCCGDLGSASARTFDLEVLSPGVNRWLEVSSVSWFRDYQTRRANVRYRTAEGTTAFTHTVNGSALAWARIWAALVETYRQPDGTVVLPDVLAPYLGGRTVLQRR